SHIMSDIEVSCLPDNSRESLELDLSQMQLNDILHLADIKLPKGVEIIALTHDDNNPVVSVHIPRVEEEPVVEEPTEAPTASEVPAMAQKTDEEIAAEAESKGKKK